MAAADSLTATAIDRLVSQHLAAWNATDPVARRRHLEATWGDDGVYQDPGVTLRGDDFATLGPDDRLQRLVVYFSAACDAAATCTARCRRHC